MNILRLILLLVSTQHICARFIAPRGSPLHFVPVAELIVRQDDSGGDGSGGSNSGNVDTSQSTVQQPAQAPSTPQQQQQENSPQQQQPGIGEQQLQQPGAVPQQQQQGSTPQQQQTGLTPQQQQQPQTGQQLQQQPQPAQPSNQQQQGSQQQQQQQQQQLQPIQQQPSQQSVPQQSTQQPPFQTQASAQAGTQGTTQQKQSGNGALSGLPSGVSRLGGLFGNFLQLGGASSGSSGVAGSLPSQGSLSGSTGPLGSGSSGYSINSVGSGNVITSAGAIAPSPGTAGNIGGACSTPNGQGTCMSMSGGCSGGSFVPGYCSAASEECCVHGNTNPAGGNNPSVIANPWQSPNAAIQQPSIAPNSAVPPQSSAGVYYGACSSPNGQGNCVDISGGCGGGTFVPGRCPVGQNTECCVPNSAGFAASPPLGMSPSSIALPQSSAGIYSGACSSPNGQGMCVSTANGCNGGFFVPGWCPVGQGTECCVPNSSGNNGGSSLGIASSIRPASAVSVGASTGAATTATAAATMTSNSISTTVSRSITSTLTASQTTNTASSTSNMYHNTTAQTGSCHSLNPTEGYSGIASISNYGNMGSACNCGGSGGYNNASWQGNSGQNLGVGQGYYSGAVNQKLFGGNLNPQGQPGCGQSCGSCYSLQTTGTNAYNGGPNGGSNIVIMVTDACYNTQGAPNWCSSNTDSGQDDYGCDVHFDIQTAGPQSNGNGPDAVGQDGQPWTHGGAFVQYKPVSCPEAMTSAFQESCAAQCP